MWLPKRHKIKPGEKKKIKVGPREESNLKATRRKRMVSASGSEPPLVKMGITVPS